MSLSDGTPVTDMRTYYLCPVLSENEDTEIGSLRDDSFLKTNCFEIHPCDVFPEELVLSDDTVKSMTYTTADQNFKVVMKANAFINREKRGKFTTGNSVWQYYLSFQFPVGEGFSSPELFKERSLKSHKEMSFTIPKDVIKRLEKQGTAQIQFHVFMEHLKTRKHDAFYSNGYELKSDKLKIVEAA
eukprot:770856_1